MNNAPTIRLRDADPRGRVDVAVFRLGEQLVKRTIGAKVWDNGLGEVVEAIVVESRVPSQVITPVDVARAIGILPPRGRR